MQPTNQELLAAFNNCCLAAGMDLADGFSEALIKLTDLRNLRTTWVGQEDHELMFMLNAYIRNNK